MGKKKILVCRMNTADCLGDNWQGRFKKFQVLWIVSSDVGKSCMHQIVLAARDDIVSIICSPYCSGLDESIHKTH